MFCFVQIYLSLPKKNFGMLHTVCTRKFLAETLVQGLWTSIMGRNLSSKNRLNFAITVIFAPKSHPSVTKRSKYRVVYFGYKLTSMSGFLP